MKKTLEIRRNLKQREHMSKLINELKKEVEETKTIIFRYEKTLEKLNYDLLIWDDFVKENKL